MNKRFLLFALLALSCLLFVSCSPNVPPKANPGQATPGAITREATTPAVTPTTPPTATPQTGKVLLVAATSADIQPVQALLTELSQPAGLVFETRSALQQADLTPDIRVVVLMEPLGNLADLAAAAPQTQFVAISSVDLPSAGNLTVIRQRPEDQAFIAGYISVLLSTDYRGGGLLPNDGPLGDKKLEEAFTNGAHYYCGVCAPGWPLKVYYPQVASLPASSDGPAWQAAAAGMFDNQAVAVYYLSPESARPEVIEYLQGKTQQDIPVLVIGAQTPPDVLKAQWAATVRFDLDSALRQAWPDVYEGKGGAVVNAPVLVENTDLLGAGRMRLVKDLLEKIQKGTVYPFTVPAQ